MGAIHVKNQVSKEGGSSGLAERTVQGIVCDAAVDALLRSPLETVVSHRLEKLETAEVSAALEKLRTQRATSPREVLAGLGFVLKAIRNKREHGFKTHVGRDSEILRPARQLLTKLSQAALAARVSA